MSRKAIFAGVPMTLVLACGLSEMPQPETQEPPSSPPMTGVSPPSGPAPAPAPEPMPPAPAPPPVPGLGGAGGSAPVPMPQPPPVTGMGGTGGSGPDAAGPAAPNPPAPPPSGATITIGGAQVPKEKVLVFLHIGHSNMAGRTTTPQALRALSFETHPRLWAYRNGTFRPAREPLSGDSMTSSCGGVGCSGLPAGAGPGMSILRTALAASPDSYVVSIGRGQSGVTNGYCRSFRKGGLLYGFVMDSAIELKGKVTFAGIWTMLGLSEVNDRSNNGRFADCMVGVANDMRTDLGEPELPFLVGDWEEAEGGLSRNSGTGRVIIPQLESLAMRISRSLLIPSDGLPINPLDGHHYDLTGHKLWAERGIALLKKNGWAPWATTP